MNRIATTHTGSLPRPAELIEFYRHGASEEELEQGLQTAVSDVVRRQADIGIDVVNDGEFGKPVVGDLDYAAFTRYRFERISGYELHAEDESKLLAAGKDAHDYPGFYASGEVRMTE